MNHTPAMPALKPKHEAFAQAVASGISLTEAHQIAYGSHGKTAHEGGSKLARRGKVSARIGELRKLVSAAQTEREAGVARQAASELKTTLMDMQMRREIAAAIAFDQNNKPQDRLAAIKLDAELAGELIGRKDPTTNGETLPSLVQPVNIIPLEYMDSRHRPKPTAETKTD